MPLSNSISNIIGTKIPFWLWQQLQTRSKKGASDFRDNEVLKYITNKTAWVRLVSSINIKDSDLEYFRKMNPEIAEENDLAKQYALFGGTSKYLSNNTYAMRSGFSGMDSNPLYGSAYGIIGNPNETNNEVAKYGYRPMPGISSVNIETQGRLGSVRSATINFKCWDKDQLDIIDALYFKLGFTMFLEWGHTFYFPSQNPTGNTQTFDPNKAISTELMSIDPFNPKYINNKEAIFRTIATNYAKSEGNYDAMLGIVTNFNFSYNQEGGYDCTLKIISLGVLGDSIKINHSSKMIEILQEQVKSYEDTLKEIELSVDQKIKPAVYSPPSISATREALKNSSNIKIYSGVNKKENVLVNVGEAGDFLYVKSLDKFLPLNTENFVNGITVSLNTDYLLSQINKNKINFFASDGESPWVTHGSLNNGFYQDNLSAYKNWDKKEADTVQNTYKGFYRRINRLDSTEFGILQYQQKYIQDNYIFQAEFQRPFKTGNSENNYLQLQKNTEEYNLISTLISNKNPNYKTTQEIGVESVGGFLGLGSTTTEYSINVKDSRTDSGGTSASVYGKDSTVKINTAIINALRNPSNRYRIKEIKQTDLQLTNSNDKKLGYNFSISFNVSIELDSTITVTGLLQQVNGKYEIVDEPLILDVKKPYQINVVFSFNETDLIKDFFVSNPTRTQAELISEIPKKQEETSTGQNANQEQQFNPFSHLSSLELSLRSIQVHSLVQAIKQTQDINIKSSIVPINLWENYGANKTFAQQIFTNGIFTPYIDALTSGPYEEGTSGIDDSNYDIETNEEEKIKVYIKYGFFTKLLEGQQTLYALGINGKPLSGLTALRNFKPVRYRDLFTSYVLPYNINQNIESGTTLNHPVYIQFGMFLMLLNHSCTIYDTQGKIQRPLVYIDYNPNHNFCLTVPHQLTTDPFRVMIPFEGTDSDYRQLFEETILEGNQIKAVSGSSPTDLFVPRQFGNKSDPNRDNLSGTIKVAFKDEGSNYRGKTMNILLNIDYLMDTIKQYAKRDEENKVFLKPLIEQILSDINKCTGNFNIFRLAYNDSGNVFYIVDDQLIEPDEIRLESSMTRVGEDNTELPLFGKGSISKNLEIKTDVSTRLSNMLAISANSKMENKGTLSTDATPFGFINYNYTDRYIPERSEITGSSISLQGEISAATDFNSAIKAFYGSSNLDEQKVSSATNYYIDKLTKIKASGSATRAAAMIPVSLNFTTDGISGLSMGQAFTVDKNYLPYTYSIKKMFNDRPSDNKVGFVITGLNHTIEANTWNTSVKTNMIFLKSKSDYSVGSLSERNIEPPIPEETPIPTQGRSVPDSAKGCRRKRGTLDEDIVSSTVIKDAYGNPVKGKKTFVAKLEQAYNTLQSKGIKLEIGDNLRSFEFQKSAYENFLKNVELQKQGKPWVKNGKTYPATQKPDNIAHPCDGYHVLGQAVDLVQNKAQRKDITSKGPIYQALYDAGIRRIPKEWWHWSLGEVS